MVSTEITTLDSCRRELLIKVPAEIVDQIRKEQTKVVQREVVVKGYRQGRAPMHMVRNLYAGTIEKYTLDEALQQGYEKGLQDTNLEPVSQPVIKNFDYDHEKNLTLKVEVEVFPEIDLKKYKGLKVDKTVYKIEDKDINHQINLMLKEKTTITAIDSPAEKGHYVTIDMQELDESHMPLVGKKYENIRIQLGSEEFDKDLEEQLIGVRTSEERYIEKKYKHRFMSKQPAKNEERYSVTVKSVEKEELPDLNEEFVAQLNVEGLNTVEELRDRVREQMEYQWGQHSEQEFYHHFAHELLQLNPFEVPESMVQNYLNQIVSEIKKKDENVNLEEVRKRYRVDALFNIKWYHLKRRIAEVENISVGDEDYNAYLESITDDKVKKLYLENSEIKQRVLSDLYEKRVFDFLVEHAKVKTEQRSIKTEKGVSNV